MGVKNFYSGSTTFECRKCGKLTRDVGHGTRHCRKCAVTAETQNTHSDESHEGSFEDCVECQGFLAMISKRGYRF